MGKCNSTKVGKTGLEFKGCKDRYGMGMWKGYQKQMGVLHEQISFYGCNGRRVKFWNDRLCGDLSLEEFFLTLFSIANDKKSWVVEMWDQVREGGQ